MRQRVTYLLYDPAQSFDPSQIDVQDDSVTVTQLAAAKEHRLTIGLSELPQEIYRVLRQCHELHIRWASTEIYSSIAPFVSRVSPGLHVFFTPHPGKPADLLCPLLKRMFGDHLKCQSPEEAFISQPILSQRFSISSALQYYQLLPNLRELVVYIQQKLCPSTNQACRDKAASLLSASYLDIDFDTISHAVVLNAYWDQPPGNDGWSETIQKHHKSETIEVGVLNNEKPLEPEELKLGGFLTVIGEDTKPKPVLFSFPSRHHPLPNPPSTPSSGSPTPLATYATSFRSPTGLHPTLQLTFPSSSLLPPADPCALHAYLTLPSYLFIDKYQFHDPLFLASNRLRHLCSLSGETDLEAPDWVIQKWGSAALFELMHPGQTSSGGRDQKSRNGADGRLDTEKDEWTVSIPLHLRYLAPNRGQGGLQPVDVPWPAVFWACTAEEGTKMATNPFDRTNLGYDGLFGDRTMFFHVPPAAAVGGQGGNGRLVERINVPVLDLDRAGYVEWGTVGAVVLGAAWVGWKLWGVSGLGREGTRGRAKAE